MSKTLRTFTQGGWGTNNGSLVTADETKAKHQKRGDYARPKKLKPYIKNDVTYRGKERRAEYPSYSGAKEFATMGNTNVGHKLEVKNSNRSMKKGVRQIANKEIIQQINDI